MEKLRGVSAPGELANEDFALAKVRSYIAEALHFLHLSTRQVMFAEITHTCAMAYCGLFIDIRVE
jgi:hypothetical protein